MYQNAKMYHMCTKHVPNLSHEPVMSSLACEGGYD